MPVRPIYWKKITCIFALLAMTALSGCLGQAAIPVGFTAELSGKQSDLGVNVRNGVEMAVDEINAAGGISGRKIKLLIEDDLGTVEGAQAAQNRLIDAGATAILGHFTSSQTITGFAVAEARGTLLLSATASTALLSGKQDLFFRTVVSTDLIGHGAAQYLRQVKNFTRAAVIFDHDNDSYSTPMIAAFREQFTALDGQVLNETGFSSSSSPDFQPLIKQLQELDPEVLLIVASPLDTAMIAQTIQMEGWSPAKFAASWAQGEGLIQNGGNAVEGLEIIIGFDINDPSPALKTFNKAYEKRYGRKPAFTAMEGYETMQMLATALKETSGKSAGLQEALLELKDFSGLTGPIQMDKYGDAIRPLYIQRVNGHKFETIQSFAPAP